MDWDVAPIFLAAIFVAIVIPTVVVATVGSLILYPIAKRSAALLDAMADEKRARLSAGVDTWTENQELGEEVEGLRAEVQRLTSRQDLLEDVLGEGQPGVRGQLEE